MKKHRPFLFLVACLFAQTARANLDGDTWIFHVDDTREVRATRHGGARGTPLVGLADLATALSLKLEIEPATSAKQAASWRLSNPIRRLSVFLRPGSRDVRTPFGTVTLSRAPTKKGADLLVPIDVGDRILRPLLDGHAPRMPIPHLPKHPPPQVVIDPGHGGNDWGASLHVDGRTVREKEITLTLAQELALSLAKRGVTSALTRTEDLYLTLPERTRLANDAGARVFLSLHLNTEPTGKTQGFELYVLSLKETEAEARAAVASENQTIPEDSSEGVERVLAELRAESNFEASLDLAKSVAAPLRKAHKPHGTGIKTGPFYVLYGADLPSLLVEWGYLTHPLDRQKLLTPEGRASWLASFSQGLATWIKRAK